MKNINDPAHRTKKADSTDDSSLISIEVVGKDAELWDKRGKRFYQRLINSVKQMLGNDIPSSATADKDIKDAVDALAESALERLKGPLLTNLERQASVKSLLAEAREKEANARLIGLKADKLEMEIKRERIHESQRMIDLLIQRGELTIIEREGEIIAIVNKSAGKK